MYCTELAHQNKQLLLEMTTTKKTSSNYFNLFFSFASVNKINETQPKPRLAPVEKILD